MENIPYLSVGNNEMENSLDLNASDSIICPRCEVLHSIEIAVGEKGTSLAFYRCKGKTYLCGMDSKTLPGVQKA